MSRYFLQRSANSEVYFFIYVYETVSCFVNKKYEINCRSTLHEQDALLEAFYNGIDEGEESFFLKLIHR